MLIGAMNDPTQDPIKQITRIADLGFDFVDFTMEPPKSASWQIEVEDIKELLDRRELEVVGHTSYYLPFASAYENIRQAAIEAFKQCLPGFKLLGSKWVNYHPDRNTPMHERKFFIERNLATLAELLDAIRPFDMGIMVENLPGEFNSAKQLAEILDPMPGLGLHLDIGHANLDVPRNTGREIIERFGTRIKHVHLHDNKGGSADLHLGLGSGNVPWKEAIQVLKKTGYDRTITLEVFTPDEFYLERSRRLLRDAWDEF